MKREAVTVPGKSTSAKDNFLEKIENKSCTVGVVGLGYVGLPLLWTFHNRGLPVLGFDIDEAKIRCLEEGTPYIRHLGREMMGELSESGRCGATADFARLGEANAVILCVPTPLDRHREPDMSYVERTCRTVGRHLCGNQLVVLESTTWPGTTEELIIPILEEESGLKSGEDFWVAYSPEREDPGNANFNTEKIPKVVGADSPDALQVALALYDAAIAETVPVGDTRTAEAVKLTENIFRSVNIALVNELKVVYERMGIDVHEVLEAAATKPFGFMKFTPGPGLGGHCIPIDPFYLTWKAREYGVNTRFIELSGEVNTAMPRYVLDRTLKALNAHRKALNGARVLVLGLAYKPDVDDTRESPSFAIMDLLKDYGARVDYHDPHVSEIPETREHAEWQGRRSVEWSKETISSYDVVVIATDHSAVDYRKLVEWAPLIVDARNAVKDHKKHNHVWPA